MVHTFGVKTFFNGKIKNGDKMVNNNIKFCRETLEMTQSELGYIFGVTKQTVSNWENAMMLCL